MDSDNKTCQLCGDASLTEFVVPQRTTFWKCAGCGLYQYGALAPQECHEAESYHAGYEADYKRKLRTATVRINRIAGLFTPTPLRLLDVGCGIGAILDAAQRRAWDPVGVDVSRRVVSLCRQRGFQCLPVDGHRLPFPDKSFDVVTAWSVIEHVGDVAETLAEWRRVLRDDGLLAMDTTDAECLKARLLGKIYRGIWVPGHTYTFTPATLRKFAENVGFQIVRPPFVGNLRGLSIGQRCYAYSYQAQYQLRTRMGLHKPFQIFLRRGADVRQRRSAA
jgi:ubiquinone/menaquinone biosynthesis C-methylase UbiE